MLAAVATTNGQYFDDEEFINFDQQFAQFAANWEQFWCNFFVFHFSEHLGGQVFSASKPTAAVPKIKGRLLTTQEGCGYSKVSTPRIVGGAAAKNGIPKYVFSLIRLAFACLNSWNIC